MKKAVTGGVTTLHTMPGSGTNLAGFTVIIKLDCSSPDEMTVRELGAMKIAQAFNPERGAGDEDTEQRPPQRRRRRAKRAPQEHEQQQEREPGEREDGHHHRAPLLDVLPQRLLRRLDLVGDRDPSIPMTALAALAKWDGCDGVINLGILGRRIMVERFGAAVLQEDPAYAPEVVETTNKRFIEFEKNYIEHIVGLMDQYKKPIFGVSLLPDENNQTLYRVAGSPFKGVFYPTPERAVKAFAKMVEYRGFLKRQSHHETHEIHEKA